jgi:hypothetical protein
MAHKKASDKKPSVGGTKKSATKTRSRKTVAPAPDTSPASISDEEIALRAYLLWESRGRPAGSPDEDWHKATEELRQSIETRAESIPT